MSTTTLPIWGVLSYTPLLIAEELAVVCKAEYIRINDDAS